MPCWIYFMKYKNAFVLLSFICAEMALVIEILHRGRHGSVCCICDTMASDVLPTQGARTSAAMVLNLFSKIIPVSAPEGLIIMSEILQIVYLTYLIQMTGSNRYHYIDIIMGAIASQITSITVVYSAVYSDADQRKHQSSASLAFVWGIHRDRWIPRTKGQLRGKCFHLMTSSRHWITYLVSICVLDIFVMAITRC